MDFAILEFKAPVQQCGRFICAYLFLTGIDRKQQDGISHLVPPAADNNDPDQAVNVPIYAHGRILIYLPNSEKCADSFEIKSETVGVFKDAVYKAQLFVGRLDNVNGLVCEVYFEAGVKLR